MKQFLITILAICGISLSAQAQLKVHSNGNIAVQTTATPLSPISLNYAGNSGYYFSCKGNKGAIYCNSEDTTNCFELRMRAPQSATTSSAFRLYTFSPDGMPSNALSRGIVSTTYGGYYNYGVTGCIMSNRLGAGIVGTSSLTPPSRTLFDQAYAALFEGDVKITGNLTVVGTVSGSNILGRSASLPFGTTETISLSPVRGVTTADLLSTLSATTYQKKAEKTSRGVLSESEKAELRAELSKDMSAEEIEEILNEEEQPDILEEQSLQKTHYALDAEQLQEVFPDLVYETKDGEKVINYVEMVPLLVQSIKELTAKVNALENGDNAQKARSTATALSKSSNAGTQATLYQNTPNPFTSQTVIRFSLPADATNAYVYIFDMQGKMIRQLPVNAAMQSVTINGSELQPGIYLYSLVVGGQEIDTKRMILSK